MEHLGSGFGRHLKCDGTPIYSPLISNKMSIWPFAYSIFRHTQIRNSVTLANPLRPLMWKPWSTMQPMKRKRLDFSMSVQHKRVQPQKRWITHWTLERPLFCFQKPITNNSKYHRFICHKPSSQSTSPSQHMLIFNTCYGYPRVIKHTALGNPRKTWRWFKMKTGWWLSHHSEKY